jgi:hypothetical protein
MKVIGQLQALVALLPGKDLSGNIKQAVIYQRPSGKEEDVFGAEIHNGL